MREPWPISGCAHTGIVTDLLEGRSGPWGLCFLFPCPFQPGTLLILTLLRPAKATDLSPQHLCCCQNWALLCPCSSCPHGKRAFSCPLALFESCRRAAGLILWLKRSPGLNFSSFPLSFHHFMSVFKEGKVPCPSHPLLFGERSGRFPSSAESSLSEVGGTSFCRVLSL